MASGLSIWQRVPRWVRALLISIAGVYVAYLLAANIILRTRLLRGWLSGDENSLLIDYSSARSILPGSVVVHDLRIRHQDRVVQMSIHIDRASLDIDLLGLARHVASFRNVQAEGVEYRLRQRLDTLDGNEGRARAFPLIDGFPATPLASAQPPLAAAGGRAWTIEVLDIHATVREVWTMEYRFRGSGSLDGGFHIEPGRIAQVFPSAMRTTSGTLSLGEEPFLDGGGWSLAATIDPFAPQETHGADVLRFISFTASQHGAVASIKPVGDTYLPSGSGVVIDEGAGVVGLDVRVDHGVVQPESRLTYHCDRAMVRGGALSFTGDLDVVARVDAADATAPRIVAEAKTDQGTMTPTTAVSDVHASLVLHGVDTTEPLVIDRLAATLGAARTSEMRAWNAVPQLHDANVAFTGGAVTVSAHGAYENGGLEGHVETKLERLGMSIKPFSVVCSGTSATDVKSDDVNEAIILHGTRVDLHDVSMKLLDGEAKGMWLSARSNDTRIATSGKTMTDASIAVESGPGEPTMKLFTSMAHIPGVAADVMSGKKLDAQIHLRVRHDDIAVDVLRAKDGILEGTGRIHKRNGIGPAGAFVVSAEKVSAGIDIAPSGVSIVPLPTAAWLEETMAKR